MRDPHDGQDEDGGPKRRRPPRPVREDARPPAGKPASGGRRGFGQGREERREGKGGRRRDEGSGGAERPERPKPTPVRAITATDATPPPVEPDLDEAHVEVDGREWIVRVVGRSGAARPSATPLMLLGFWTANDHEGDRAREALTVGRTLAELTPAALRAAFRESVPPPPEPTDPPPTRGRGKRRSGSRGRKRGR